MAGKLSLTCSQPEQTVHYESAN